MRASTMKVVEARRMRLACARRYRYIFILCIEESPQDVKARRKRLAELAVTKDSWQNRNSCRVMMDTNEWRYHSQYEDEARRKQLANVAVTK